MDKINHGQIKYGWILAILIMIAWGCKKTSEYHLMESRELATDVRYDSLFFGLYLGMPAKDFYNHCWELNKKGLIRQGASNTSVHYDLPDFKHPAGMDFYPRFYEDKIVEMPLIFIYDAWSPWNKNLSADSLILEVKDLMTEWYGEGFLEIKNPKDPNNRALVKVDGNRRISIYNLNDSKVQVDIVDLRLLKSLEKNLKK